MKSTSKELKEKYLQGIRDFGQVDLSFANLQYLNLPRVYLKMAILAGAHLERANLTGVNLSRASNIPDNIATKLFLAPD